MIIGIDFDNTIINYNQLFYDLADRKGWLKSTVLPLKKEVRDHVRTLPCGEEKWQQLQAMAYGDSIHSACLEPGFISFLHWCENENIAYYIVSHKTEFSTKRPDGANLQDCAKDWLRANVFTSENNIAGSLTQVFFEPTRKLKIKRLSSLNCSHFIDDLEEFFAEPTFPTRVKKILFADGANRDDLHLTCSSWPRIHHYLSETRG